MATSCREAEGGVGPQVTSLPEVLLDSTNGHRTILSEKELCELRFTGLISPGFLLKDRESNVQFSRTTSCDHTGVPTSGV